MSTDLSADPAADASITPAPPIGAAPGVAGGRRLATGSDRRRWWRLAPLALIVIVALIAPLLETHNPLTVTGPSSLAPNGTFWFGTDSAGLDVYSRTLAATRTNLRIASLVAVCATVGGILVGLLIGVNESSSGPVGWLSRGVARVVDLVQAVPAVLTGLVVVSFYGASPTTLTIALAVILAPIQVRLVRTEVLRVRTEAYLDAARMAGQSESELTFRHVLPNSSWAALENTSVIFAVSIVLTAALGFIGVGLPPPAAEWGSMLARGATDALVGRWWSAAFPTLALALTVAAVSMAAAFFFGPREARR